MDPFTIKVSNGLLVNHVYTTVNKSLSLNIPFAHTHSFKISFVPSTVVVYNNLGVEYTCNDNYCKI